MEKELGDSIIQSLAIRDMLSYLPDYRIVLEHIQGTINPADVLTKSVDVNVMTRRFLSRV